jgi:hypothetical protein
MSVTNYFILTEAEKNAATAFDNEDVQLGARPVDNATPGVGINLNDNAANFDAGDVVPLTGKFICTKRIVDDGQYQTYAPAMVAYLLDKPFCMLEPETIFAPVEI